MDFVGTVWALLPPVIAIVLALITKEVYMSLFIGVVTGALLYTNFSPVGTIEAIFEVMMEKLGDSWNVGILIFPRISWHYCCIDDKSRRFCRLRKMGRQ